VSDRNLKANFSPVDGKLILERLSAVPITTWNYQSQDPSIRHMGPMAQDFFAAFGLGESERHIGTLDADGVALAAIQGLHEMLRDKEKTIRQQQNQISELEQRLLRLEAHLSLTNAQLSITGGRQ